MRRLPLRSPPRVRGKALHAELACFRVGITPAYAGKSCSSWLRCSRCGDHPRVCGEKSAGQAWVHPARGSPPRMRGKDTLPLDGGAGLGITPAYAGKSKCFHAVLLNLGDHPRVCGEKSVSLKTTRWSLGSPPRVRGKAVQMGIRLVQPGITPAYAGKSPLPPCRPVSPARFSGSGRHGPTLHPGRGCSHCPHKRRC